MILKQFIQDVNNIMMEEHIVEALMFQGGLVGKTVVVIGCYNLTVKCIANVLNLV